MMKKNTLPRALALLLCVLTALMLPLCLGSCAASQTPLLTLEGETLSVNQYELLLSRVKGTFELGGYSVDSADFWDTVVSGDNTTYDTYIRQAALRDAKQLLAASILFEEEGLSLPASVTQGIDEDIDDMIVSEGGSKSALNAILAAYGVNVDILRELYIIEAKHDYLRTHLYGENGSKIAAPVKQEYLTENAVCFKQLLIRAYDYVYETDANGDEIYYLTDENDGQTNNIAYDVIKGNTRTDEYGKVITDKNGDEVYYLSDGRIAYDTEKGARAMTYDDAGYEVTEKYSAAQLQEHREIAEDLVASVSRGDYLGFEARLEEYCNSGEDQFLFSNEYYFLYTTGDNSYDYLNDIADALAEVEVGEVCMVDSEYGYNVVMKYEMPSDAASNTEYSEWFSDLSERVMDQLFYNKCKDLMEAVVVDEEAFAAVRSMKDIGVNYYY